MSAKATGRKGGTRVSNKRVRRLPPNALGQEQQHFLLTAGAVTMSEGQVARLSEAEAYEAFKSIRFAETGGEPVCPRDECGHPKVYTMLTARRVRASNGGFVEPVFKCAACRKQFTATSGQLFSSRKMSFRDILHSLMAFVNAVSGEAALRLRRAVGCSYKTAFVLGHKLRVGIARSRDLRELGGNVAVEVDGKIIGGHRRPYNDRRNFTKYEDAKKRRSVVAVRERGPGGESRMTVAGNHETDGFGFVWDTIAEGSEIYSDSLWSLGGIGPHHTVVHSHGFSINGIDSNQVESLFARLQRAEEGVYYRIIGHNLDLYAQEVSWREDYRREANGDLWLRLLEIVTQQSVSLRFKGYWQRWQHQGVVHRNRNRRSVPAQPTPI